MAVLLVLLPHASMEVVQPAYLHVKHVRLRQGHVVSIVHARVAIPVGASQLAYAQTPTIARSQLHRNVQTRLALRAYQPAQRVHLD